MAAARRRNVPPTPRSLSELSETLDECPPMQRFFKGCTTGTDGSVALIFMHDAMIEPLSECTQLYCDGTFKVKNCRLSHYQGVNKYLEDGFFLFIWLKSHPSDSRFQLIVN